MSTSTDASTDASVAAAVQSAVAAYAHALDANRIDDLVELFHPDGVAEIAGVGTFEGHDAIRQGYAAFAPTRPQLHLVGNTVVTSATEDEATAVSNLAFFQRGDSGWAVQLVGRYDDTLRRKDGEWRFQRRVTTFLP
ncbi:nuclear transport factor 2 family protein [Streptomyces sp. NBC_01235]|uniref:nuclear transport factor 2 family protein n=1 Tax=Streptomyces sp. NBC_01235 TaxID=2903788 RepID=UPI002E157713|nr:nuclear transport factor 2 family protein [Streptomyces sp. NBC_01235]